MHTCIISLSRIPFCCCFLLYTFLLPPVVASPETRKELHKLLTMGQDAYREQDYESSDRIFKEVMKKTEHPSNRVDVDSLRGMHSSAVFWLVRSLSREKKFDAAETVCLNYIGELKRSMEPAHRLLEAYCTLGLLQMVEGNLDSAHSSFAEAQSIGTKHEVGANYMTEPLIGLASIESQQGRLQNSANLYEKALQLVESNNFDFSARAYAVQSLARVYEQLGRKQQVEDLYKNVISNYEYNDRLDQEGIARTFSGYGALLAKDNRLFEAEPQYKKAFEICQKYHDRSKAAEKCRSEYADLLRKLNRPDEAKKIEEAK